MYYGVNENDGHGGGASEQTNPLDIDSSGFKVDQYMEKMLKELSLTDLYDRERKVKKGEWVWSPPLWAWLLMLLLSAFRDSSIG